MPIRLSCLPLAILLLIIPITSSLAQEDMSGTLIAETDATMATDQTQDTSTPEDQEESGCKIGQQTCCYERRNCEGTAIGTGSSRQQCQEMNGHSWRAENGYCHPHG